MIIEPIQDILLVEPDARETSTPTGIHIPDNAQQIILTGFVRNVGPGRRLKEGGPIVPVSVKAGDRILFQRHMGTEMMSGGTKMLLLRERYVDAVLGPDTRIEIPKPPPPPPQNQPEDTGGFGDDYAL